MEIAKLSFPCKAEDCVPVKLKVGITPLGRGVLVEEIVVITGRNLKFDCVFVFSAFEGV